MKITVTDDDREEARRSAARVARGLIDDAEIDGPDEGEIADSNHGGRAGIKPLRDAPVQSPPRRRKPTPRVA